MFIRLVLKNYVEDLAQIWKLGWLQVKQKLIWSEMDVSKKIK